MPRLRIAQGNNDALPCSLQALSTPETWLAHQDPTLNAKKMNIIITDINLSNAINSP